MNRPTVRNLFSRNFFWTIGILVCSGTAQQASGADFLIVEKVDGLTVYNKYQQETSRAERALLVPFVPMKVIKRDAVLGDGFTPCMQVEVEGQVFYLLRNRGGDLLRSGRAGYEKMFSNAIIFLDTVHVLTGKSFPLLPIQSHEKYLSAGELLVRVFRHQGLTYCRTLSMPPVFGWVDFSVKKEGRDWAVANHRSPSNAPISPLVAQKVQQRVEEVNRILKRLFQFFNSHSGQRKPTPAWKVESSNTAITCVLGGADNNEQFGQSTFYLVNEVENIALGSEFQVTHTPGRIEIRPK